MVPVMMDSGGKTSSTERELRHGQIMLNMKVTTGVGRRTDTGYSIGLMDQSTKESLRTIVSMERVFTTGMMVGSTMVTGSKTRWTVKEFLPGQMDEGTRVNTEMTRKKDMVYSVGKMVDPTKGIGRVESNMVEASTSQLVAENERVNG